MPSETAPQKRQRPKSKMLGRNEENLITILGVVRNGGFVPLEPADATGSRLTNIAMQEATGPEAGELDLLPYEDNALLARGYDSGGWHYSAELIDEASPLLTAVVLWVFSQD
jgi:hypothetical protein